MMQIPDGVCDHLRSNLEMQRARLTYSDITAPNGKRDMKLPPCACTFEISWDRDTGATKYIGWCDVDKKRFEA